MKKSAPPPIMNILCLNDLLPPKKCGMKKKKINSFFVTQCKSQHRFLKRTFGLSKY